MIICDEKKAIEFASNPGNPIHEILREVVDKNGKISLEVAGVENTDDIIQSQCDSCDIHVLISRLQMGDIGALNVRKGLYGDFTEAPKTMAEALQIQLDAKRAYNALDKETKKKFDNDFNQFLVSAGTEEWYKNLGFDVEQPNVDDVKEGVSD